MKRPSLCALLATLTFATGQTAPPAELTALRERISGSLTVADRTVTSQWLAGVAELEKSRAAAGDYEGARRARLRREQALAAAGSDDGRMPFILSVRNVTGKGTGLVVSENKLTTTFGTNGAFMEWDLTGDFKGWYEIMLTHGVPGATDSSSEIQPVTGPIPAAWRKQKENPDYEAPSAGGWVSFQNMSSLGGGNAVLRREIVSTGGWNAWRPVSLGRIQLAASRLAKFRITGEEVAGKGLMQFKQLELVPVSDPAAAANGGEARLTAGRQWFEKEFRTRIAASSATYKNALTALEQQAVRTKDNDLLFRVREEVKRLAESPDKLALSSDADLAASPAGITLTVGNSFGCQYRGDITLDTGKSFLTKLKPAGTASITWRLSAFNVGSGAYDVTIKGRIPVNGGGSATLAAFGESSAPAGKALAFDVKPVVKPEDRNKPLASGDTAPTAQRRTEEPGRIVINKGAQTLTLSINGLTHGDGWLMDLTSITLTRTGDIPPEKKTP